MKKIGLALGGGGARGSAHIGVLIELEQLGIRPDLIVGTSIGGMLGALYAAGLTTDELTLFFTKLNLSQLYTLPGSTAALTGTVKIESLLEKTIGRPSFDQLKYPLAVVTCDLVSRKVVVLDEGDVITAVLSTIAIPLLFPPVEKNGMALVDGGLMNNTPFDIALARGAAHTIAV
ncbi:MAG: patatin, partial [Candidatus Thermofonsia bacterium]